MPPPVDPLLLIALILVAFFLSLIFFLSPSVYFFFFFSPNHSVDPAPSLLPFFFSSQSSCLVRPHINSFVPLSSGNVSVICAPLQNGFISVVIV